MTRFARARGSKSSNQRIPDEATPWEEMKDSTIKSSEVNTHDSEITDWKSIINTEKKVEENVKSVWCDFGSGEHVQNVSKEKKKRKRDHMIPDEANDGNHLIQQNSEHKDVSVKYSDKKYKKSKTSNPQNCDKSVNSNLESDISCNSQFESQCETQKPDSYGVRKHKGSRNWSVTGREIKCLSFKDQAHKRRKRDNGDVTLDVNGEEITVTRLDGFYIRKEDAERIKELEKDLLKRGVSKEEIRAVVKKERRNAEKSLARQKKKVCFHCRKGGHNLSSCPKLNERGTQIMGSGICYKCGSTEHSHLNCRVSSGQSYKFATCFICKEEGHIARQCPDNPRGLYPNGGGCKLCGDVTHLKKDCPTLPTKANITVGIIDQDIETLDGTSTSFNDIPQPTHPRKKNKIIKFQ